MTRRLRLDLGPALDVDRDLLAAVARDAAQRRGWELAGTLAGHDPAEPADAVLVLDTPGGRPGHGLDGLPWAVGAAVDAVEHPAEREPYGPDPDQYLDWRGPRPGRALAVLLHGGYYRSRWPAALMVPLAADLAARGWRTANLEYRRPDRHGWAATVDDVRDGVLLAARRAPGVPVVVIGHSAGGQLALQVAEAVADDVPGMLAVSLAGVVDLVAAHDRFLGEGAVGLALGGGPADLPERYAAASPLAYPRRRARWLLVQGADDSLDLVEMNRRLARGSGPGPVELIELPGDHFDVIDPATRLWQTTVTRLDELVAPAAVPAEDAADPAPERAAFAVPYRHGRPVAYLAANALGLQPSAARDATVAELDRWARLAHDGHHHGDPPWSTLPEAVAEPLSRLVGARPAETLAANGLTVDLHLLMASFYRPAGARRRILMEAPAFPSDAFAVRSQLRWHGLGDDALLTVPPRTGDVLDALERHGDTVALVLLGGVNFHTGELLDVPAITRAARAAGCVVGWDLAHAVGNVELALHDWDVDWAAWCSYKYLNGGPGAVAGLFVHERHHARTDLNRLAGWYGQPVAERFGSHDRIHPAPDATAWQVSNPPVLALAPVLAAVRMIDRVGMPAVAARGRRLAAHLERLLHPLTAAGALEQLTPADPNRRGAQLSYRTPGRSSAAVVRRLHDEFGVVADAREPDLLRLAPSALYTSYADCDRAAAALAAVLSRGRAEEAAPGRSGPGPARWP